MATICYRELRRRFELDGAQATVRHLREALRAGHLRPEDFSLRELAEALIPDGRQWVGHLDPRAPVAVAESAEGVDVTAFLQVTGQIIYTKILEAYQSEAFVLSRLVPTIPTRLDGERIPGVGRLGDVASPIHPGMPYPHVGLTEEYVETPSTTKHGLIIPITREAIFFDRTGLILRRAAEVGQILALSKEKRLIDTVIGAVNSYRWNGRSYQTYYAASDGGPWVNALAGNALVDWTSVDKAEALFADMLDPSTGEPIVVEATTVLVTPAYRQAARRIFYGQELSVQTPAGLIQTGNILRSYRVYESRLLYRRIIASGIPAEQARTWWFIGDFSKAFAYMENWPITVTQSPPGSEAEFTQDIVVRFKASERGTPAVLDPRYVVRCTG
ncbi:MAG: hypothetical protein NZ899_06505 [Thermoguttaceae bacterium]|nr:hypothetical protein [Thermoguttaceae bacterium]MDW8079187.1 hypothetical protein [Thermoguttaceae bacterium]